MSMSNKTINNISKTATIKICSEDIALMLQKYIDRAQENATSRTTITLSDLNQLFNRIRLLNKSVSEIKY